MVKSNGRVSRRGISCWDVLIDLGSIVVTDKGAKKKVRLLHEAHLFFGICTFGWGWLGELFGTGSRRDRIGKFTLPAPGKGGQLKGELGGGHS